jgi:hypothetical protein
MSEIYDRVLYDFQTAMAAHGIEYVFFPRDSQSFTSKGFARGMKPAELIGGFEQNDLVLTISAQGVPVQPKKYDRVEIRGRSHSVIYSNPLMAGDAVMGYKVFVRGGN